MKRQTDFTVVSLARLNERNILLKLTPADRRPMESILAGQFVEILIDREPGAFLRRPISVHYVDAASNELWLLVQIVGDGTRRLAALQTGEKVNLVYPLGKGFTMPDDDSRVRENYLLVGGGVGVAPLLYTGAVLARAGKKVTFLLGWRSAREIIQLDEFKKYGRVFVTTEDGTIVDGCRCEPGFVTAHSICQELPSFDAVKVCGPKPMMAAVANWVRGTKETVEPNFCEVSLENKMACGLGVCLCCVEDTTQGHRCVCSDGPVFDINDLKW